VTLTHQTDSDSGNWKGRIPAHLPTSLKGRALPRPRYCLHFVQTKMVCEVYRILLLLLSYLFMLEVRLK